MPNKEFHSYGTPEHFKQSMPNKEIDALVEQARNAIRDAVTDSVMRGTFDSKKYAISIFSNPNLCLKVIKTHSMGKEFMTTEYLPIAEYLKGGK